MVTSLVVASAGTAVAGTPPTGGNIEIFNKRSMVALEGYAEYAGRDVDIDLLRSGKVVATAEGTLDASGFFEVNHPGGGCWIGVTPVIRPGDEVRVAVEGESWTDSAVTMSPTVTAVTGSGFVADATQPEGDHPGRVVGRGTVTITGTYDPADPWFDGDRFVIETVNPENRDAKTPAGQDPGLVDSRALGISLVPDAEHPNGEPGRWEAAATVEGSSITGTYTLFTEADYDRTLAGDHVFASWMADGPADLALGLTQNEFEEIPGPGMGGCPASPDGATPTAPATATLSSATGSTSIGVAWTTPAQAADAPAVSGYRVAAIGGAHAEQEIAERTGGTSVSLDGLGAGQTYRVTIEAYNGRWSAVQDLGSVVVGSGAGGTPPSDPADPPTDPDQPPAEPTAPAAPAGVTPAPTSLTAATVTWPAVPGATSYTVTATDAAGTAATAPTIEGTTATFTGLTAGATYTVSVTATNDSGTGPAAAGTLTQPTAVAPSAPGVSRVLAAPGSITAEWVPATPGNEFSAITGYEVRAFAGGATTPARTAPAGSTATQATVTGLTNGTAYRVEVVALSGALVSLPGTPAAGVSLTATPRETVAVTRAQVRSRSATQHAWRIEGTTSTPSRQVTFRTSSGTVIGTVTSLADGSYRFAQTNAVAPPADSRITARIPSGVTATATVTRVR